MKGQEWIKEKRSDLYSFIRRNADRPFLLLCHHNADPDALGSAIALSGFLLHLGIDQVRIGVAQSVASYSKPLTSLSPVPVDVNPDTHGSAMIILDTASPEQLNPIKLSKGPAALIDHHGSGGWNGKFEFELDIVDPSRTSTAEIVWDLLKDEDFWSKEMCMAVMAGIITDTAGFRFSNQETFRVMWEITERCDVPVDRVMSMVSPSQDRNTDESRRMAILKACQRMELRKVKGYVIAVSRVSAYEALACKTFVQLGADVAIVGSNRGSEVRISARARDELVRKGLDLGSLMESIGSVIGGSGGGHAGAAGANGSGNLDEGIEKLIEKIEKFLRELDE